MKKIVFICTGNTCRSPMAEVMFREMAKGSGIEVCSAGIFAEQGRPMSENARLALERKGLDGSAHRSRQLTADMLSGALPVCMTRGHLDMVSRICPGGRTLAEYDISDPYGMSLDHYNISCDEIERALGLLIKKIQEGEI